MQSLGGCFAQHTLQCHHNRMSTRLWLILSRVGLGMGERHCGFPQRKVGGTVAVAMREQRRPNDYIKHHENTATRQRKFDAEHTNTTPSHFPQCPVKKTKQRWREKGGWCDNDTRIQHCRTPLPTPHMVGRTTRRIRGKGKKHASPTI